MSIEFSEVAVNFLARHGFLPQGPAGGGPPAPLAALAPTPASVAEALQKYQAFHGLEQTAEIDKATARHMALPRVCGLPDYMAPAALELTDVRARWPDPRVRWFLATPGDFPGLSSDQALAAIAWAFEQWASVCGIQPQQASSPQEAHVLIECRRIDGPFQVLAWSELADGTMSVKHQRFDQGDRWCFVQGPNLPRDQSIDLGRVACHELGHVLGVPHIQAGNLMQPTYSPTIWLPQPGDVAEVVGRYGKPASGPPPPPPGPPAQPDQVTITLTVNGKVTGASVPGFRVTPLA